MSGLPLTPALPQVSIDGVASTDLRTALSAMVVHVLAGRATAHVEVVGTLVSDLVPGLGLGLGRTVLAVHVSGEQLFTGELIELETRTSPSGAAPLLVLRAEGIAPLEETGVVELRIGADLESGSVQDRVDGRTARGLTPRLGLRRGSQVILTTADPHFDGPFEVVELWHRWDAAAGLRTEFLAHA